MTRTVKLYDAKTNLSELVDAAAGGEEIIIAKRDKPLARLVAYEQPAKAREPGALKGKGLVVADNFDAPLPSDVLGSFEQ